jgi:hypothetical protein
MKYVIMKDGLAVTGVLNDWDEVLDFFDDLVRKEERLWFDIVELGTVRKMTEWTSKGENGATLVA